MAKSDPSKATDASRSQPARKHAAKAASARTGRSQPGQAGSTESDTPSQQTPQTRESGRARGDSPPPAAGNAGAHSNTPDSRVVEQTDGEESNVERFYDGTVLVTRETTVSEHGETTQYPNGTTLRETTTRKTVRVYRDPAPAAGPASDHPLPVG